MIQLNPDCLIFQTGQGENIPCSAETVTIELIGEAAHSLDPGVVREAAAAVVHYFREELGRDFVSVAEFSEALQRVLNDLGLHVTAPDTDKPSVKESVAVSDLQKLAGEAGDSLELLFFARLRQEMRSQLTAAPGLLRFRGLRPCVKQLLGTKRWNSRCQNLNDQIVNYLRECLSSEQPGTSCGLMVN
jgi:hypothetical protein